MVAGGQRYGDVTDRVCGALEASRDRTECQKALENGDWYDRPLRGGQAQMIPLRRIDKRGLNNIFRCHQRRAGQ